MNEFFATFNSAWAAISGVVFLIIWVYRMRIETSLNQAKIKDLESEIQEQKEYMDNKLSNTERSVREEISKLREEVQLQLGTYRSEQKEKMESLSEQISRLTEAVTDLRIEIKSAKNREDD